MQSAQYDKDCTTWNPDGKITQISHAMEAVKQGTPVLALRSKNHAVLAAFMKKGQSEFCSHDKKIFKIDDHMGIGISGLTADARVLADYMRGECLQNRYVFEAPLQLGRLVSSIGEKAQIKTQVGGKRPYGVGMLVVGYDQTGPHVYETCPSANYYEYYAMAIGGRSNSAKTYLEKHFESFDGITDLQELIRHAVKGIAMTVADDHKLSTANLEVAIVGKDQDFKFLSEAEKKPFVDEVEAASGAGEAMDTSA